MNQISQNIATTDPVLFYADRLGESGTAQSHANVASNEYVRLGEMVNSLEALVCSSKPSTIDGVLTAIIAARGLAEWEGLYDDDECIHPTEFLHKQGRLLFSALTNAIEALMALGAQPANGVAWYLDESQREQLSVPDPYKDAAE